MEKRIDFRILQQSPDFKVPKPELEQYATPTDIVIDIVKQAYSLGHLDGTVADLGCGTGRLAIGAALTGAEVTGYEIDIEALDLAKKYSDAQKLNIKWINSAIENIKKKYDTVLMNPPFGSQVPGADGSFLQNALNIAKDIWSIHIGQTKKFIERFVEKNNGKVISAYEFDFPIKKSMPFHTKESKNEKAILYHIASLQ